MIAFITWKSNLVPSLGGLCSWNSCRFKFSVFEFLSVQKTTSSTLFEFAVMLVPGILCSPDCDDAFTVLMRKLQNVDGVSQSMFALSLHGAWQPGGFYARGKGAWALQPPRATRRVVDGGTFNWECTGHACCKPAKMQVAWQADGC